jgi:hypothetical protein
VVSSGRSGGGPGPESGAGFEISVPRTALHVQSKDFFAVTGEPNAAVLRTYVAKAANLSRNILARNVAIRCGLSLLCGRIRDGLPIGTYGPCVRSL